MDAITALSKSSLLSSAEVSAPVPQAWVERIFTRLSAQLGSKVADLYAGVPTDTVKAEWADALSGFHPLEISRGLSACQTRAFAPTLGEFLRLCRPALDSEVAWWEAQACMRQRDDGKVGDWSHPAVFRAAREVQFELRTRSFKEFRKHWEWLLQREFAVGWGDEIKPRQQLERGANLAIAAVE